MIYHTKNYFIIYNEAIMNIREREKKKKLDFTTD